MNFEKEISDKIEDFISNGVGDRFEELGDLVSLIKESHIADLYRVECLSTGDLEHANYLALEHSALFAQQTFFSQLQVLNIVLLNGLIAFDEGDESMEAVAFGHGKKFYIFSDESVHSFDSVPQLVQFCV